MIIGQIATDAGNCGRFPVMVISAPPTLLAIRLSWISICTLVRLRSPFGTIYWQATMTAHQNKAQTVRFGGINGGS